MAVLWRRIWNRIIAIINIVQNLFKAKAYAQIGVSDSVSIK